MPGGRDQHQVIFHDALHLQTPGVDRIGDDAGLGHSGGNDSHDFGAGALLELDVQAGPRRQPGREPGGQESGQRGGIRVEAERAPGAGSEILQLALEQCLLLQDQAGVMRKRFPGLGGDDAASAALQQPHARIDLDLAQPLAGRGERQMGFLRALRDAAGIHDRQEQAQVREI